MLSVKFEGTTQSRSHKRCIKFSDSQRLNPLTLTEKKSEVIDSSKIRFF